MKDGFIKVAAGVPKISVADVTANCENIKNLIEKADSKKVNLLVLPELCITGYTCGDLFLSNTLISSAEKAFGEIVKFTKEKYPLIAVGLPVIYNNKLFNCAAFVCDGKVLAVIPKSYIPNYSEFCEKRYFVSGSTVPANSQITLCGNTVPFGTDVILRHSQIKEFTVGAEICEDVFAANQACEALALGGAGIIVNLSASNELVGKEEYRRLLIRSTSARLICGYVYVSAGNGESTTDLVFSGHSIVAENGRILAENKPFEQNELTVSEIDVSNLSGERIQNTSFIAQSNFRYVDFDQQIIETELTRMIPKTPFVPYEADNLSENCEHILKIQSFALKKRLEHTNAKKAVIGISGGLDSTLALLAAVRSMKLMSRPASDIMAVTMPCFGTTKRTRSNSEILCNALGVDFLEVNITDSVKQHFADIGQDQNNFDVTFENSQARERTQVLMDIANKNNGIVVGTGDLSELALGWATYSGDHISMYGVNAGIPKTLVRSIVRYEAENSCDELKNVLLDILDTPVSPELLPSDSKGEIAQKTEDLVGPYELHDFFIYHTVRYGEGPKKIFRLAKKAFADSYDSETIIRWLTVFARRFFSQQFKRSCLPDGPKVGSVGLSPRENFKMPSDASCALWLKEISEIKK